MGAHAETPSRELEGPDAVAAAILDLYHRRGEGRYDEAVTQTTHGCQTAGHAIAAGAGPAMVAAAFLHDIGHLLSSTEADSGTDRHHELVGSRFLGAWFGDEVTEPIRLHVAAKRRLCATDPAYRSELSPASTQSLALQGGPMTDDEVEAFDAAPAAHAALRLRRWDDLGKDPDAAAPSLDEIRAVLVEVLSRRG